MKGRETTLVLVVVVVLVHTYTLARLFISIIEIILPKPQSINKAVQEPWKYIKLLIPALFIKAISLAMITL